VLNMLERQGLSGQVEMRKVLQVVEEKNGMPVDITRGAWDSGERSVSQSNY
jgi:hypothetical protein